MTKRHIRGKDDEMDKYENTFFSSVSGSFPNVTNEEIAINSVKSK